MIVRAAAAAYVTILVLKRALALRYARGEGAVAASRADDPVTIVQAILGGDPALAVTLAWNLREHPTAVFVWLVDRDDEHGARTCIELASRAASDIRIVSCEAAPPNDNPKLFKLALAEATIATERFVVLDDDTMLPRAALAALQTTLDSCALATGLPSYEPAADLAGTLVEIFVNDNAALAYLATAALLPPVTINGMCYATTRAWLRAIGGFGAHVRYLPDDLAIARAVRGAGGTIRQTAVPHRIRTSIAGGPHYVRLMHRWFLFALFLLDEAPLRTRATIVVLHATPPLLLWTAIVAGIVHRRATAVVTLAFLFVARAIVRSDVRRRIVGRTGDAPILSLLSELAEPLHALHATFRRTIRWRSRRIVVRAADDFSVVSP